MLGSAESPAACSGTGAGPAGTPGGSLPLAGGRHVVRPQAELPEAWGLGEKSDALTADTPHAHLPTHLLLWLAAQTPGSPGQSRVLARGSQEFPVRGPI